MKTLTIPVQGMTCSGCTTSVQRALSRVRGVNTAEVRLQPGDVTVSYDPTNANEDQLIAAIEDAGFVVPADWQP